MAVVTLVDLWPSTGLLTKQFKVP